MLFHQIELLVGGLSLTNELENREHNACRICQLATMKLIYQISYLAQHREIYHTKHRPLVVMWLGMPQPGMTDQLKISAPLSQIRHIHSTNCFYLLSSRKKIYINKVIRMSNSIGISISKPVKVCSYVKFLMNILTIPAHYNELHFLGSSIIQWRVPIQSTQ